MRAAGKLTLVALLEIVLVGEAVADNTTTSDASQPSPVATRVGKVPIPNNLQALVRKFEKERCDYLTERSIFLAQLKEATAPAERTVIQAEMQQNSDKFVAEVKRYRQDLRQEIIELKDKLDGAALDELIAEVRGYRRGQEIAELKDELNNPELERLIRDLEEISAARRHHGKT